MDEWYEDDFEEDEWTDEELDNMTTEEFMEIPFNKASVYVFGCLQHLNSLNLITLGRDKITPKGISLFDQLKATGYKPTPEQTMTILLVFKVFDNKHFLTGLNTLVHLIDMGNEQFEEFIDKHEKHLKDKTDGNSDILEEPEPE